jgi:hypothetical protein
MHDLGDVVQGPDPRVAPELLGELALQRFAERLAIAHAASRQRQLRLALPALLVHHDAPVDPHQRMHLHEHSRLLTECSAAAWRTP